MSQIKHFFCFYSLPLLSAGLMAISYIPFPPYALFFCYVPLWIFALRQKKIAPLFIGSWVCQFCATLLGFHWLAYTFREFGFFSWPLSLLGLLGFASFANLHIPIALMIWFLLQKLWRHDWLCGSTLRPAVLVLFSALSMEYYPMIFEWHWGYSWFYAGWPALQTAELWGFKFLNTVTLFFNFLALWGYLLWWPARRRKAIIVWGVLLALFACLNVWGLYLKARWPKPDKKAQVLVIQPNIENLHRVFQQTKKDPRALALNQLVEETSQFYKVPRLNTSPSRGGQGPDFILWPEGAYPYHIRYREGQAFAPFLSQKAREWQTPLLLSATGESPLGITNSLFAFSANGKLIQAPYNKVWLLAFGEYLPGEKWFNWSHWLSYYGRSFKRGTGEYKTLDLTALNKVSRPASPTKKKGNLQKHSKAYRLGFQICYEGLFDFWTRDLAREKAHILVNVTNDSWYGRGFEPYQHLYMTLARAIEVRRPLIRGTNTGFSAVISAKGEILKKSALYKKDSYIQEVPYYSQNRQSLWTSWGYYINSWCLCLLTVILFSYLLIQGIKKNRVEKYKNQT